MREREKERECVWMWVCMSHPSIVICGAKTVTAYTRMPYYSPVHNILERSTHLYYSVLRSIYCNTFLFVRSLSLALCSHCFSFFYCNSRVLLIRLCELLQSAKSEQGKKRKREKMRWVQSLLVIFMTALHSLFNRIVSCADWATEIQNQKININAMAWYMLDGSHLVQPTNAKRAKALYFVIGNNLFRNDII